MNKLKQNTLKAHKLSATAKQIDKQLMDLLVSELENLRNGAKSTANTIKIA